MSEIKYFPDTPAEKLLQVLWKIGICSEAEIHYSQFSKEKSPNATVKDMVESTPEQHWAAWYLQVLGKETDTEMCKVMIAKIEDPMLAFLMYLKVACLTDEEDKILESIFKGKVPTVEQELKDGIVSRKKESQ